jgi:hypothetical protein
MSTTTKFKDKVVHQAGYCTSSAYSNGGTWIVVGRGAKSIIAEVEKGY